MATSTASPDRAPDVDLSYLECEVSVARPMFGADDDPIWTDAPKGISMIRAKAILHVFDDEHDGDSRRRVIARAGAYAIDLDELDGPGDVLDAMDHLGGDAFSIVETIHSGHDIFTMLDGEVPFGADPITQLIVVEEIFVEEPYRGQRIGPRLLTTLTEVVGGTGFSSLIVLRAQPLQWQELTDLELHRARKKVAAAYEGVGFTLFRDGVYWRHSAYVGTESLQS